MLRLFTLRPSISPTVRVTTLLAAPFVAALSFALAGCGSSLPPRRVKSADLASLQGFTFDRPLIIELEAGDVIPLVFKLDGPFLKTPDDAPPIPLRVTRHFFLRVDGSGLASSIDGEDFDKKSSAPGQFQVGVGVTREGLKANISIRTPTPANLPTP